MSTLGDRLREVARECASAAHLADGDFTAEITDDDIATMERAWLKWDSQSRGETHLNGYRAELRALVAAGWRKPRVTS